MEENNLSGKKILYIGLDYFGYPSEIIKELNSLGAEVDFFPIFKPGNKIKIIRRLSKRLAFIETKRYFNNLLKIEKEYDFVFFITVHWVPVTIMHKIKNKFNRSKFILYNWDSLKTHDYLPYLDFFDSKLSFDKKDCEKHHLNYLPLFFISKYESIRNNSSSNDFNKSNLVFIGRFNNIRRYNFVKETCLLCEKDNVNFQHYLNIHWTTFLKTCIQEKKLLKIKLFKFKKLNFDQIADYFSQADCIIDLPNNYQNGLTMRVIETLGSHRKLITTNDNVRNEPIYNSKIISIVDLDDFRLDTKFIKQKIASSDFGDVECYSLRNWLKKIFCDGRF